MQFQFRYPKGYEHAKWKKSIAPGLEIRAHSNYYVVAPPSMHRSGVRYEYENPESARIYAPQWLIDLAEQRQTGINLVSETALKGERHHNIVAIAGMNRHKDIPLDTALNQCLDYNKNHCSPSKAEYLVRNAVTDVYCRYEPGRAPKPVLSPHCSVNLLKFGRQNGSCIWPREFFGWCPNSVSFIVLSFNFLSLSLRHLG